MKTILITLSSETLEYLDKLRAVVPELAELDEETLLNQICESSNKMIEGIPLSELPTFARRIDVFGRSIKGTN